ncbi:MAG TPA: hypothetical protein EYN67_08540 [Flavobacteriales bacterium]|jgi:phage baseplate assembly protein W|nr:hypothetical protein [Flavobacteriales bacterium]
MASGISIKVPLLRSPSDGHDMNKTYKQVAVQNLKMLIMTSPGERVMDPLFGVGLRTYIFESDHPTTHSNIAARIRSQVKKYLPYIDIREVLFDSQGMGNPEQKDNTVHVQVKFKIIPLEIIDEISLSVS